MKYIRIEPLTITGTVYNAIRIDEYTMGGFSLTLVNLNDGVEDAQSQITENVFNDYDQIVLDERWFSNLDAVKIRKALLKANLIQGEASNVYMPMGAPKASYEIGDALKALVPSPNSEV